MGGFIGWLLAFLLVAAIFNAEKLPALREILEEKFKNSVDAAKEGSKLAKTKLKKVKSEIENKRNAAINAVKSDAEENTPEEIAESLQFMGNYLKTDDKGKKSTAVNNDAESTDNVSEPVEDSDKSAE